MFRPTLAIIRCFIRKIYIVVLLTVITLPINYYTIRGWHILKSTNSILVLYVPCIV